MPNNEIFQKRFFIKFRNFADKMQQMPNLIRFSLTWSRTCFWPACRRNSIVDFKRLCIKHKNKAKNYADHFVKRKLNDFCLNIFVELLRRFGIISHLRTVRTAKTVAISSQVINSHRRSEVSRFVVTNWRTSRYCGHSISMILRHARDQHRLEIYGCFSCRCAISISCPRFVTTIVFVSLFYPV